MQFRFTCKACFCRDILSFSFVSECGASVYSVTEKAKAEFANLDPNLISAGKVFFAIAIAVVFCHLFFIVN